MVRMPSLAQLRIDAQRDLAAIGDQDGTDGTGRSRKGTIEILHPVHGSGAGHRRLHRADRKTKLSTLV